MGVINFQESLRARINQMADEHLQMQEAIMDLPEREVPAALDRLERHAAALSRLASRLEDSRLVPSVPEVPNVQAPSFILPRVAGEERGGGSEEL